MDEDRLLAVVEDGITLQRSFFREHARAVLDAGRLLSKSLRSGHKIMIFGNGGSAADAQHFSAELVNRFREDRPALAAIALTTDASTLTSIANDSHYDEIFSRQIEALGAEGDVAVGISTSGGSANVVNGIERAREKGLRALALSGRDGGKLAAVAESCLTVPHQETARIQEVHGILIHMFCQIIEDELFP